MPGDQIETNISAAETSAPVETPSPAPSQPAPASTESPKPSETSGETSKETLLDAVLKVVPASTEPDVLESADKDKGEPPAPEDAKTEAEASEANETQDQTDEASGEDDETGEEDKLSDEVPAVTRKKFNRLLNQRRELRKQVEALAPAAEIGQQLQNYASANNLSSQDVVFALDLASLVAKGDYVGFYQVISPLVRHAQEVSGVVLPPDLHDMVEQGQMSPEAARQFAQTRFERAELEARANQAQHQQQEMHVTRTRGDVQQAVTALEERFRASDPDYKAKADLVRRTAQAMLAENGNRINSVDDALRITKAAYDEVNRFYRKAQPAPRPTAPSPTGSNPQTPSARATPNNLMEAALAGLARSRRAG